MALPCKLSLQQEARQGLKVGPRLAKRSGRRRESEGKRHLSVLPPLSLIDDPSDESFCQILWGPSVLAGFLKYSEGIWETRGLAMGRPSLGGGGVGH